MLAKSMGSPPPATSCEGCSEKKETSRNWEKAKREFDSIWGTPFHGVKAIAKKNKVAATCLKCYVDRNVKHNHGYDTGFLSLGIG